MQRIKHLWQRITRGFSDDIIYDLDEEIVKWLLPRLKRFKEISDSYPAHLKPEEWEDNLNKMIKALEIDLYSDEMDLWQMYPLDSWQDDHRKKLAKERKDGFEILHKYLSHLWL